MSISKNIHIFYDKQNRISAPTGIIMGPDHQIWFTSLMNHAIGRINPSTHEISMFFDSTDAMKMPANIYPGPDRCLWFTCVGSNHIGRIDPFAKNPANSITLYSHSDIKKPVAIKCSSDGYIWFSARESHRIGRIHPAEKDPGKSIQTFSHHDLCSPAALFITEEDQLFFTNKKDGHVNIGFLDCCANDPGKTLSFHDFPGKEAQLRAWAQSSNEQVWLTVHSPDLLVCFNPNTFCHQPDFTFLSHPSINKPDGIYSGKDGYLYFVNTGSPSIGRLDPSSSNPLDSLELFEHDAIKGLCDIKPGPDDAMWFTDKVGGAVGKIDLAI